MLPSTAALTSSSPISLQLLLMLQFLLPLSLAHALRECVYGELDHPLSTVISGPWTAVSGGSVRHAESAL